MPNPQPPSGPLGDSEPAVPPVAPAPSPDPPRIPEAVHRRRWAILTVLMFSLLIVVLDNSILNVAVKTIASPAPTGIGATQGELEWAINSYTLLFAGLLFTAGLLGDRIGRKKVLLFGIVVFGLGSALAAFSTTPGELIAYRGVMGFGAAFVMPSTLAVLMHVFEPDEQPKAIGIWAGSIGLAIAIGPVTGGVLIEHFWWGSIFLVNVPVVVIALIAMAVLVPESKDPAPGRTDPVGVLLSIVGLVLLVYGIIRGGELADFTEPSVLISVLGGLAVLVVFVWHEKRSTHPAIDMAYFRLPAFSASVVAIALVFFAMMGITFLSAYYLQSVRGYSALECGLLVLPLALAQMFFSPRARLVVARFGARAVCAGALVLIAVGLGAFAFFDESTPMWVFGVSLFVQGVGMSHITVPVTTSVMQSLPREKAGSGSAVSNTFRQVGGALGVAVLGSMLSIRYRAEMEGQLANLPTALREGAGESIEGTHAVARELGPTGEQLITRANAAFIDAMQLTSLGAAVVCLIGVAVVLRWLPGRDVRHPVAHNGPPPTEGAPPSPRFDTDPAEGRLPAPAPGSPVEAVPRQPGDGAPARQQH